MTLQWNGQSLSLVSRLMVIETEKRNNNHNKTTYIARHFRIYLRARGVSVFRNCSACAERDVFECFAEDTNSFWDLEHVKRKLKEWFSRKGRQGLLVGNLKERPS